MCVKHKKYFTEEEISEGEEGSEEATVDSEEEETANEE